MKRPLFYPLSPCHRRSQLAAVSNLQTSLNRPCWSCRCCKEASSAQHIFHQHTAASGGQKVRSSVRDAYAMGKLKKLAYNTEIPNKISDRRIGGLVLMLASGAPLVSVGEL